MMENITLGQILGVLTFLGALIGSLELILVRFKKSISNIVSDEIKPLKEQLTLLKEDLDNETMTRCKSDLVSILSKIKTGYNPTIEEKRIIKETKDLYNSKGGDSYVDDLFDDLRKEGKI